MSVRAFFDLFRKTLSAVTAGSRAVKVAAAIISLATVTVAVTGGATSGGSILSAIFGRNGATTASTGTPAPANNGAVTQAVSRAAALAQLPATPATAGLALSITTSRDSLASDGPKLGTPVPNYKWQIQQDNTGDPQGGQDNGLCHPVDNVTNPKAPVDNGANFTVGCPWPSIQTMASAPVVSNGDQSDWGSALLALCNCDQYSPSTPRGLKGTGTTPGKYLVSVTADGYELGGAHFTVPFAADPGGSGVGTVKVKLNPYPIPLGTIRLRVCLDQTPVSGTCDVDTEKGLAGFHATLSDYDGIVSVDYYGNPLCTKYQTDANGLIVLSDGHATDPSGAEVKKGHPVPLANTGGQCLSDANGNIVIQNMPPNHYSARVIPPTGLAAVQTTTLEGNHDFDVWASANDTGYDTELVVGGEPVPFIEFGFVEPLGTQPAKALTAGSTPTYLPNGIGSVGGAATGSITGQVFGASAYLPGISALPGLGNSAGVSGQKLQNPVPGAWVALNSLSNNDTMVYAGPAQANDGTFTINNVPNGDYAIAVWDYNQNYLLDSFNVTVSGGKAVDLGILPLNSWWTRISGKVCVDTDKDGKCGPTDPGISKILVQNLMRGNHAVDGGINTAITDTSGHYALSEGYPLGQMVVEQVYNQRFKTVGITYQACNDPQEHTTVTPAVDLSYLATFGLCARIDWALIPYNPSVNSDNGGIVATVLNDPLRLVNPARQQIQFDYFTGIPGVQVDMYNPIADTATYKTPGSDATGVPTTTFTQNGATDTAAAWNPGQWQGYTVVSGRTQGTVASNTANTLTLAGSGWTGGIPVAGAGLTIHDNGFLLCTAYIHCAANDGSYAVVNPAAVSATNPNGYVAIDSVMPGTPTQPLPPGNATVASPSYVTPAQSYVSEHYGAPTGCVPMDANGAVLGPQVQNVAPVPGQAAFQNGAAPCVESLVNGVAIGGGTDNNPVFYTDSTGAIVPADVAAPADDPTHPYPGYSIGTSNGAPALHGIQTVDGNYGITPPAPGDVLVHIEIPGDKVLPPTKDANGNSVDRPLYHISTEQDRNDSHGMVFVPQGSDPTNVDWQNPAEAPNQAPTGTYPENPGTASPTPDYQCAGPAFVVNVTDGHFLADGGSPFQGQTRNLCDTHLLHVEAGQSVAPNFHVFTDVPLATKFSGLILDDASLDTNHNSAGIGDVNPIPGAPVGVYDWAGNLQYTTRSDYNGVWSVLMPSSIMANCLTPTGFCPSVYRFVGNDPGQPDAPNYDYNPQYRTIAANFQAWPGQLVPADVAPTIQAFTGSVAPGQNYNIPAGQICMPQYSTDPTKAASNVPQLFTVDKPYTTRTGADTVTVTGLGFGSATGSLTLTDSNGTRTTLSTTWTDRQIVATIPGSLNGGAYQLDITSASKVPARSGITYHILRGTGANAYKPSLLLVNPPAAAVPSGYSGGVSQYTTVQDALDAAAGKGNSVVVVFPNLGAPVTIPHYNSVGTVTYPTATKVTDSSAVWAINEWSGFEVMAGNAMATILSNTTDTLTIAAPGWQTIAATPVATTPPANGTAFTIHQIQTPSNFTPLTAYYENVVIHSAVKLQGTGPGGVYPMDPLTQQSTSVAGSVIDGRYFFSGEVPAGPNGATGTVQTNWDNLITGLNIDGPAAVPDAAVITVVKTRNTPAFTSKFAPSVDGIRIQGGSDNATAANPDTIAFQKQPQSTTPFETQGGAIYVHAHADFLHISNNLVATDSGVYGDIRIGAIQGSPTNFPGPNNQPNHNVVISKNSIIGTGGTNFAGALGIFTGSDNYLVDSNFFCGNHSSEYGGAISHFGLSPNGKITNNTVAFNESIDEGAGIIVAGETPPPGRTSPGAGTVEISHNYIAGNIAGDDGGGIRFLTAGLAKFLVSDNVITNNVSNHEGGGISIDNAPHVTIVNNTIAKNITTATAPSSDGTPAPAGISTGLNSNATDAANHCTPLPGFTNCVSQPTLLNNILWDNRAGSWSPQTGSVSGIGNGGPADIVLWDLGTADNSGLLSPHYSLLETTPTQAGGHGYTNDGTNKFGTANDPQFVGAYDTSITVTAQRTSFRFRPSAVVTINLPANLLGDYGIPATSPAYRSGRSSFSGVTAPTTNVDNAPWPGGGNNRNMGAK